MALTTVNPSTTRNTLHDNQARKIPHPKTRAPLTIKLGKHWIAQVIQLTSSVKVIKIWEAPRRSERSNGALTIFAQRDKERFRIVSCEKRTSRMWDPRFAKILEATRPINPSSATMEWSAG